MSTTATRLTLADGRALAEAIIQELRPSCERIEIAGSIRRRRPFVHDIELVAIPKRAPDLFDLGLDLGSQSRLDAKIEHLCEQRWSLVKDGYKYKQVALAEGCTLDLFICSRETWGSIFTIRTGPAEFSKRLVTARRQGGLCPAYLRFKDGRLWKGEMAIDTPEERNVFDALDIPWLEPWERE